MDGSHIQKEKVAASKISGYVWTGPISVKACLERLWPVEVSNTAAKHTNLASEQVMINW